MPPYKAISAVIVEKLLMTDMYTHIIITNYKQRYIFKPRRSLSPHPTMTPDEREIISALGSVIIKTFCEQAPVVFLYAILVPLGVLNLRYFLWRQTQKFTAGIILFGLLSATCLVVAETGELVLYIYLGMIEDIGTSLPEKRISTNNRIHSWNIVSNAFETIPLLANDGLIIWRAWVIFSKTRWALYTLVVLWLMTAGAILASSVTFYLGTIFNYLQYTGLGLTFGTNLIATSFIGYVLWSHRKAFNNLTPHFLGPNKVWNVLVLLFEMGFIYCMLQLIALNFDIKIPDPAVPAIQWSTSQIFMDIFLMVYAMFSTMYPILVALVIQGSSVMLGIHETATSITESQVDANVV
ncbi:hypothetical protein C0995_005251 [Termitomyces sp. Mi166|nr:hypothetical protein C0995_005251 [Termitomyces sp. Mi166\